MVRPTLLLAFALTPNRFGSMELFGIELARQFERKQWNVVFCFEGEPTSAVRDHFHALPNVTLEILPDQSSMSAASIAHFARIVRRYQPQVVMYWLGGVVRWWPLVGKLLGVKRTVYYDGSSRTAPSLSYRAPAHVRMLMKPLSVVVCVTRFIKACSDREGIIPPEKSQVIYSGVDTARRHGDGQAFRRRFAIPSDRLVALQVSWLVPEKGIDVALRAACLALAQRSDLHFVFCGDGEGRQRYTQAAQDAGIADHVTFTGQVEDLVSSGAFHAADFQLQCSQWHEAFCLAVAEGMSAGLPIVASRIGGLPELVQEGQNGFLFEPASDSQLMQSILKLADSEQLRQEMGRKSRERAELLLNLADNVTKWVEILLADEGSSARS